MIIDCHTHIFPEEMIRNRASLCEREEGFAAVYGNPRARMAGLSELMASMDETGVDRSVICGFSWEASELCSAHNEYLIESLSRHPGRLIPFLSLPFSDPGESERELRKGLRRGARGVGETAFYSGEITADDLGRMKPVLALMEREGIPLLLHTNENVGHLYPGKGTTPLGRFIEIASLFPNLRLILAHWGGGIPFYELMPEVAGAMKNVLYDVAASPFVYSKKVYLAVSSIIGPERILFGSDFPLISPKRYFQDLNQSGLSEEARRKILGLNLAGLLRLGPETTVTRSRLR
jgi:predicted TIM-barrel fold metal-dependent hydrolase